MTGFRFLFVCMLCIAPCLLQALECCICGDMIRGRYLASNNKAYCSEQCFHSTLPTCRSCGKRCVDQCVRMQNMTFCSRECLHKRMKCSICKQGLDVVITVKNLLGTEVICCRKCSKSPRCYFCVLPAGNRKALSDGRYLCHACRKDAVVKKNEIMTIFRKVRTDLAKLYGYDLRHPIRLHVVDQKTLNRRASDILADHGNRMGLMQYHEKKERIVYPDGRQRERLLGTDCSIYILHTVPRDLLYDALAHELTHDHLRHNAGVVKDIALEEGFCELMASLYNKARGAEYLNRMKEQNPSPVYGEGYRKIKKIYQRTGSVSATLKYVR